MNAIVRLPHPRSGDSQGQETFLAPSADNVLHRDVLHTLLVFLYNIYIYVYIEYI